MIPDKIKALRKLMQENGLAAYLVPSADPHQSEYVPTCWERRKWISGFTGSAGDLAVTTNKAGLWTDSRYFLQAEEELKGSGIDLFKMGLADTPSVQAWLATELKAGDTVGIDPRVFSVHGADTIGKSLKTKDIRLQPVDENLVDRLWTDQPAFPDYPAEVHPLEFAGESMESKLGRLREKMQEQQADLHVVSALDQVAWLFNLRGRDVAFNPVVIAYAVVTADAAYLFLPGGKDTPAVHKHLGKAVQLKDYDDFKSTLQTLSAGGARVWLDPGSASRWILDILPAGGPRILKPSPITGFKAQKNPTEIEGMRSAHRRDGAAMVRFLHWLENTVPAGGVTELSAAAKAEEFRREQKHFRGLSFNTIAAYGEHGAIVHYASSPETDVELKPDGIFLFDSGGQYLDGTTDITRTVALGKPTAEQKDRFTRVLQGMIRLSLTRFPAGTAGNQLDTIARKPLWDIGLNYGHGTGHGVGAYLNVHEGPQGISYYRGIGVTMELGMITSNEPGFYKAGEYGIRIENLVLTVKEDKLNSPENTFYRFDTLTLCPIDLKLVDPELLLPEERAFLNEYHLRVREELAPLLNAEDRAWLEKSTRAV